MSVPTSHTFSKSEIRQAEHIFREMLIKHYRELWSPPTDAEYIGKSWDCRSMIALDPGLWRLSQAARHAGAQRVFGKIEVREGGTVLRCIIFYNKVGDPGALIV